MAIRLDAALGSVPSRNTATGGAALGVTLTVPNNVEWKLLSAYASFVGTAATGDRQPAFELLDNLNNVIYRMLSGTTYAAGATMNVQFGPAMPDLTAARGTTFLATPIDHLFIPGGHKIRVRDSSTGTATGDTLTVGIMAIEFGGRSP